MCICCARPTRGWPPARSRGSTGIYKSLTARELFKALPALRRELWGGAFWSSSYFAATVGQFGGHESVRRYVEEQGQRPGDFNLWLPFPAPGDQ